ncbi:DUF1489 family protein [Hirschia litorea]|uniref:DUF1489 family protein n=1 Tax=Hirschia litorea TaxID=1199156 RepID=A0ABW2IGQ3_9PROT
MIKLAAGAESVESFTQWQQSVIERRKAAGLSPNPVHETRMMPKRGPEIINGGSMYWVIKHKICLRQRIIEIERVEIEGAPKFCLIHFDPELVPVHVKVKRPFQGWRYLKSSDAPPDISQAARSLGDTPLHLALALKEAGVW